MDKILYDTPVEINEKQYHAIRNEFGGVAPHRKDEETGKYYFKLWYMSYRPRIEQCLINNQ
jgi:hypothetical protein